MDRRSFLRTAGGVSLGLAVAGLGACSSDDTSTTTGAEKASSKGKKGSRPVKLGFIALTDCAPIVMAQELGYFGERDLDVTVELQASWPALRDGLLNGTLDGAHALFSMPLSVATLGDASSQALKVAMMLSQNGQGITLANELSSAGYGDLDAAKEVLGENKGAALGMTFPGGTHDTWLRYWLMAAGVKFEDVKIDPIPPPQMVQNMSVGNVSGYCVGEPWNAVAVQQDIGFTHLATQDLWQHHPEKALVVNETFATEKQDVLKDVMAAVLQASKWLDEPKNRSEAADTLGTEAYVNAPPAEIRGRLTGEYDLGADLGTKTFKGDQMQFFRDGEVSMPRRSHAIWFLAQYQRFGLLKEAPPYKELADSLLLSDLYAEVAEAEGVPIPDDDMSPFEVKLDEVTFDPEKPEAEAKRT